MNATDLLTHLRFARARLAAGDTARCLDVLTLLVDDLSRAEAADLIDLDRDELGPDPMPDAAEVLRQMRRKRIGTT